MANLQNFGEIPDLSGETVEISLKKVRDHLYQLREQLNYVLTHLGTDNLSESTAEELKTFFTSDIEGRIEDDEEHLSALDLTAKGLALSFADGENRLSALEQDVAGITLSVRDQNGDLTSVKLQSGTLDLENLVFSLLKEEGATVIDGGNIKTGTISAVQIAGVTIRGSTVTSESDISRIVIDDGAVTFFDHRGDIRCGSLSYDDFGNVALRSLAGANIAVESDGDLTLRAAGRLDIEGEVYINGVRL